MSRKETPRWSAARPPKAAHDQRPGSKGRFGSAQTVGRAEQAEEASQENNRGIELADRAFRERLRANFNSLRTSCHAARRLTRHPRCPQSRFARSPSLNPSSFFNSSSSYFRRWECQSFFNGHQEALLLTRPTKGLLRSDECGRFRLIQPVRRCQQVIEACSKCFGISRRI